MWLAPLLTCAVLPAARGAPGVGPDAEMFGDLRTWVRSHGGFANPKVDLDSEIGGIVATGHLAANERLFAIPVKLHVNLPLGRRMHNLTRLVEGIPDLSLQHPAFASFLAAIMDNTTVDPSAGVFTRYFEKLGRTDFSSLTFHAPEDRLKMLEGSPEHYLAKRSRFWYEHDYIKIKNNVHRHTIGAWDWDRFVRANQLIATRAFTSPLGECLVPLADSFNHADKPLAEWQWVKDPAVLWVKTLEAVQPGTQITVSYGTRSNARLLSTYGFTMPPYAEPEKTFRIWLWSIVRHYPTFNIKKLGVDMQLNTRGFQPDFEKLFVEAAEQKHDSIQILNTTIRHHMEEYEKDPLLAPFLATLEKNRAARPRSSVWWSPIQPCGLHERGAKTCGQAREGADLSVTLTSSAWEKDVVRAKMGEYVCLLAHHETLLISEGVMDAQRDALAEAEGLFESLWKILDRISQLK